MIGILSMQGWTATARQVARKKENKEEKDAD